MWICCSLTRFVCDPDPLPPFPQSIVQGLSQKDLDRHREELTNLEAHKKELERLARDHVARQAHEEGGSTPRLAQQLPSRQQQVKVDVGTTPAAAAGGERTVPSPEGGRQRDRVVADSMGQAEEKPGHHEVPQHRRGKQVRLTCLRSGSVIASNGNLVGVGACCPLP